MSNEEKKKKSKIGIVIFIIVLVIALPIIALVVGFICSPEIYLVTTARYGRGTEEDNKLVNMTLGEEEAEERFAIYFQWYNVLHELGHGIITFNGKRGKDKALEEQLVNDFAMAYWRYYGEAEKFEKLRETVTYAASHIPNPSKDGEKPIEYAQRMWNNKDFFTFNNYGWFQFNSALYALRNPRTLEDILTEMGVENFQITEAKILEYEDITEEVSTKVIQDAVEIFREWGLKFPDTYQRFDDDPNNNYSGVTRNFLGVFDYLEE